MIYQQLARKLRMRINSDHYRIGDALPSEKSLANHYQVSRMTLRRAISLLVEEGLLERRQGSGTYILKKDVQHTIHGLNSFAEHMQLIGKKTENRVTQFSVIPAPLSIAAKLHLEPGEKIYYIQRIRFVEDKPRQVEDSYMPAKLFPTLSLAHMQGSKFRFIEEEAGLIIEGHHESFAPILAEPEMARMLEIPDQDPLLQITSTSYSSEGKVVDLSVIAVNVRVYQSTYYFPRNRLDKQK
ncbi:GntR family transcriptional regulator [Dongshaea marina]|uniref:GntR family transcriptional regulator n=1 Tax=Dongshaea marina TaxID=2047966 RepID=UPI000D3E7AD9|nr:GntR family transcriptional regulator [Dongshaea marina]